MDFTTLPCKPLHDGIQYTYKAENGFGASIVRHEFSYGNHSDLWELAVLDTNNKICYNTHITNDVLGYLSEGDVNNILVQISHLNQ